VREIDVEVEVEDVQEDALAEQDVCADLLVRGAILLRLPDISLCVVALVPASSVSAAAVGVRCGTAAELLWRDGAWRGPILAERVRLALGFGVNIELVPCPDKFSEGFATLLGLASDEEAGCTDELCKTQQFSLAQRRPPKLPLEQKRSYLKTIM
jgi:hypothetical protein